MNAVTRSSTSRCSGVASTASSPAPSPCPRTTLTSSPTAPDRRRRSAAGSVSMASVSALTSSCMCWRSHGTAVNCTRWVTSCRQTHSRKSPRVDLELPLDGDEVRGDEQQLSARPVEELELAEHLAGQEAEHDADLHAGEPAADAARPTRPTGLSAASLSTSGVDDRAHPAGVGVDPGRTVDHAGDRGDRGLDESGSARRRGRRRGRSPGTARRPRRRPRCGRPWAAAD